MWTNSLDGGSGGEEGSEEDRRRVSEGGPTEVGLGTGVQILSGLLCKDEDERIDRQRVKMGPRGLPVPDTGQPLHRDQG